MENKGGIMGWAEGLLIDSIIRVWFIARLLLKIKPTAAENFMLPAVCGLPYPM
jgi:hypothetical protein